MITWIGLFHVGSWRGWVFKEGGLGGSDGAFLLQAFLC